MFIVLGISVIGSAAQDNSGKAAAQSSQLNARDMFLASGDLKSSESNVAKKVTAKTTKATPKATVKAVPDKPHDVAVQGSLGIRYTILRARPGGGQTEVLPAETIFKAGDMIRLSVESNRHGYLYVIQQGSTGAWKSLYPQPGEQNIQVDPGKEYIIPSQPEDTFTFDEHAGQERLFVVLSQAPVQELETLVAEAQQKNNESGTANSNRALDVVMSELVDRDLVFTKASKDAPPAGGKPQEAAMYVVNPKVDGSRVVVDMTLKHQ